MLNNYRNTIMGLLLGSFTVAHAATDCNQVTEIPVSECQSLLELYNSTNGANWINKTGWNQTNTPCSWFGITCSGVSVNKIALNSNGLKGQIPDLNLSNLKELRLSYNQLTKNIPDFSNIPNLGFLGLWENQLSGSIPNFSNLPNLQSINVHTNLLVGSLPNFNNLPNLQSIDFSMNQLSGSIPNFSNLQKLQELRLSNNKLSGEIPNFNQLPNLKWLEISSFGNQLGTAIPSFTLSSCPLPSISPSLEIQIPHLNYNGMTLSANLRYAPRDGKILFEVVNYSINLGSCASANLSTDFKLHIPTATFGDIKIWADLQLFSSENNKIIFELIKYGTT